MHEIEVEVVNPKVGQGFSTSCLHVLRVVLVVPQLGGDEELPPGHARGDNARSNLRLVAVDGGAVEMAVSLPEGVCRSLDAEAVDRMVAMTLRMKRPLANALGPQWHDLLTPDRIVELYERM